MAEVIYFPQTYREKSQETSVLTDVVKREADVDVAGLKIVVGRPDVAVSGPDVVVRYCYPDVVVSETKVV